MICSKTPYTSEKSALYQKWRQENLAEGRGEGLEKGREEERRSIALKMFAEGISLEIIAKITGYSISEVERCANEQIQSLQR